MLNIYIESCYFDAQPGIVMKVLLEASVVMIVVKQLRSNLHIELNCVSVSQLDSGMGTATASLSLTDNTSVIREIMFNMISSN